MENQSKEPINRPTFPSGRETAIGIGLVVGISVGAAFGNVGVGIALGLVFGVVISLTFFAKRWEIKVAFSRVV
jgi:hypothetical protein